MLVTYLQIIFENVFHMYIQVTSAKRILNLDRTKSNLDIGYLGVLYILCKEFDLQQRILFL